MKDIELLAPAGSYEKAKIAFMYGADCVYVGTPKLSLRSRSEVSEDDIRKITEYAHSIGKKVNVALNIYAWDDSYQEIDELVKKLDKANVDAIIASDIFILPEIIGSCSYLISYCSLFLSLLLILSLIL